MKSSGFQQVIGGSSDFMKVIMNLDKGCGQLSSNDTLFSGSLFIRITTAEEENTEGVDYCGPVNKCQKVFSLTTLEKLMKVWPVGYHLLNITPIVHSNKPLMPIGYNYIYQKVVGFISEEEEGSNEPVVLYLSSYPDNYSNFSICPILFPRVIGSYLSAFNVIYNHNSIIQSGLSLEKHWVIQSGYFRLSTTMALGIVIKDGNLLFWHGISEKNMDKTISMR